MGHSDFDTGYLLRYRHADLPLGAVFDGGDEGAVGEGEGDGLAAVFGKYLVVAFDGVTEENNVVHLEARSIGIAAGVYGDDVQGLYDLVIVNDVDPPSDQAKIAIHFQGLRVSTMY